MQFAALDAQINGLPVRQINGCRHYGPRAELRDSRPPQGSELFVARIPNNFNHRELLRLFFRAGTVYDVRIMLNLTKENKGFAFVRYTSPEVAESALDVINGYRVIKGGKPTNLVAMISTDHRILMLTGCSPDVTREEVERVFNDIDGADVESVTEDYIQGYSSPVFNILFETHRGAALMKKKNWKSLIPLHWGSWVHLTWQPNEEVAKRLLYKLEKKSVTDFIGTLPKQGSSPPLPHQVPGLPRTALSSINTQSQNNIMANTSAPRVNNAPPTNQNSSFNPLMPSFNITNNQNNQNGGQLSPGNPLLSGSDFNLPRGISSGYLPPNHLSGNDQVFWNRENSVQNQPGGQEPTGAWGGAPLQTPPNSPPGINIPALYPRWSDGGVVCPFPDVIPGQANPGLSPPSVQNEAGNQQVFMQEISSAPVFGRPIRGRGNCDQAPKPIRF